MSTQTGRSCFFSGEKKETLVFFKPMVDFQWGMVWQYLVYKAFFFLAALWKQRVTFGEEKATWLHMETLCSMYTNLLVCICKCQCAYLSLVLQHVVSLPSAQLVAAAHWEIQPAALVQHPRRFPLSHAKRSGNEQKGDDVRFNSSWETQGVLWTITHFH